ncbi:hypothetical protein [Streptomyces sp. NPDC051561]|uniref:hypothetical protein n=1 Tax=Streptomyces sp. NPDC051561 TaxID=3365658 RepID=UPI0037B9C563
MWQGHQGQQGQSGQQGQQFGPGQYPPQHQPDNPYLQPAPRAPAPPPAGGPGGGDDGGRRTRTTVVIAAAVVVVACATTVILVRGGAQDDTRKDDQAVTTPSATTPQTPAPDSGRQKSGDPKPVVAGWKTVVNPKLGLAFDVPPEWDRKSTDWASYVAENEDPEEKPLVGFAAPGMLKEKWCVADGNENGGAGSTALATAGSRGERKYTNAGEAARNNASQWLYGAYTQPDRAKAKAGPAQPFTTASGLRGSLVTAASTGAAKKEKCSSDGKVTAFAFARPDGALASWTFVGAKGVADEVPDATVRKIASTVRLVQPTS